LKNLVREMEVLYRAHILSEDLDRMKK